MIRKNSERAYLQLILFLNKVMNQELQMDFFSSSSSFFLFFYFLIDKGRASRNGAAVAPKGNTSRRNIHSHNLYKKRKTKPPYTKQPLNHLYLTESMKSTKVKGP